MTTRIPALDMHTNTASLDTSLTRDAIRSHADGLIAVNGRRTAMVCGGLAAVIAMTIAASAQAAWFSHITRWDVFGAAVAFAVMMTLLIVVACFGKAVDPGELCPHQDAEGNAEAAAIRQREG